jgi:hypothetical protein
MPGPARLVAVLVLVLAGIDDARAAAERVVDVPTRPGVTVRVLLGTPDGPPVATALLFAGGHGGLRLRPDGSIGWGRKNFLVRSRARLVAHGIATVVLDAPSDRRELGSFRTTGDHAADVAGVIRWARKTLTAPVWLVGTSLGTVSVANAAVRLGGAPDGADGVVLTAAILDNPRGGSVTEQDLGKIRVPALVVQHRDDGCPLCTPALLGRLEGKLSSSPRRQIVVVAGGVSEGPVCEAMAHHGFSGVEDEVVAVVARFVGGPARGVEPAPAAAPAAPDQRAR